MLPQVVKNIIPSNFSSRIPKRLRLLCKSKAILLMSGCLEGRDDRAVHQKMAADLEPQMLEDFSLYLTKFISKVPSQAP